MGRWLFVVAIMTACGGEGGDDSVGPLDALDTAAGDLADDPHDDAPENDAVPVEVDFSEEEVANDANDDARLDASDSDDGDQLGGPDGNEVSEDTAPDTTGPTALPGWSWVTLPELPRILQEHATVALDGEVVVLGGFENLVLVDAVHHYDPVGRTFRQGTPLPRPLHHVNAAVVDGELMVLGALEGFAFAAKGDVWVLRDGQWNARTSMSTGRQRGSAGVAVVGDDVILVGGFRGGAVDDVDIYLSAEDRWERLPDLPGARDHGGAATIDNLIYAVGGRQGGIGSIEADLWRLDPRNPELGWESLAPMPTARGGFALGVVGDKLVVVGGEGNAGAPSGVFAQAELYDPATGRWYRLPDMPAPRHGMQAVSLAGVLYVPGGADVEAFGATATFQALVAP